MMQSSKGWREELNHAHRRAGHYVYLWSKTVKKSAYTHLISCNPDKPWSCLCLYMLPLIMKSLIIEHRIHSSIHLTCRVGEVNDAGGRLQQVRAAWRQVARDGHDGHTVTTLLGTNNAVVLRVTHAAVTGEERKGGRRGDEGAAGKGGWERQHQVIAIKYTWGCYFAAVENDWISSKHMCNIIYNHMDAYLQRLLLQSTNITTFVF